jgi:hypothetical protein
MRGRDWSPRREYPLHRNGLQTKCDVRHGSPSQSPDKVRSIRCLGSSLAGLHSSYLAYPHRPRSTCHHAGIGRDATQQDEPPDNRAIAVRPRRVTSMETVRTLSGDCGVATRRPVALCREINRTLSGIWSHFDRDDSHPCRSASHLVGEESHHDWRLVTDFQRWAVAAVARKGLPSAIQRDTMSLGSGDAAAEAETPKQGVREP